MTEMSNILTPHMAQAAQDAEPHEILLAIHKRVVDTEKLMAAYRTHAQNLGNNYCDATRKSRKARKI